MIKDFLKKIIGNKNVALIQKYRPKQHKITYSQFAEDILIDAVFQQLKIDKPSYLDIGSNDPIVLSNTYLFYERGSFGVCVEPDPSLLDKLKVFRPNDIVLNLGVGTKGGGVCGFLCYDS